MNIQYRIYEPRDKTQLEEMIFSLYNEDPEGEPISLPKINDTINALTKFTEKGSIVIFEEQGIVVGYSILIFYWSNEYGGDIISIDELYVKPEYRGKRYGTNFMSYLTDVYKNKAKGFMLEVTPSNNRSYKYYQRLGFIESENKHMLIKL